MEEDGDGGGGGAILFAELGEITISNSEFTGATLTYY